MLIKDIDPIKKFVNAANSVDFETIESSIQDAENEFIIPVIGQDQYDELNEAYEPVSPSLDEAQEKLLLKIQRPLSFLAFMLWMPEGMIKVTGSGFQIVSTEEMKTAWQWQTDKLELKYLRSGMKDIDLLLEFMEANKADYETWAESSAYTITKENFIPSAKVFTKYFEIGNSRRMFMRVKPMMLKIEDFIIKANLGETYYNSLKASILEDDVSDDDEIVLTYIQKAMAPLTIARALEEGLLDIGPDGIFINLFNDSIRAKNPAADRRIQNASDRALQDGNHYMQQLRNYLNANATAAKYVDYFNSSAYSDPTSPSVFNNSEEKRYHNAR